MRLRLAWTHSLRNCSSASAGGPRRDSFEGHGACNASGMESEATQTSQFVGNLIRAQHGSHTPSFDGADRHAGKTCRSWVLRKCSAAGLLDGLYAQGSVGAAAREDNADCAMAAICGQRSE
jgi:hypothetical protein